MSHSMQIVSVCISMKTNCNVINTFGYSYFSVFRYYSICKMDDMGQNKRIRNIILRRDIYGFLKNPGI